MINARPKTKFRSAVKWALVMNWGTQGIASLVTFMLAAILGPRDYGMVAMAMLYISFIQMFLAQGLAAAIVQRKDLQSEHVDSVFWMTLVGGVAFAGVSVALSGWWEAANRLPGLATVINALSVVLIIRGLTIVQEGLLRRQMDFKSLALRSNLAALMGGAAGVTLAFAKFGVWSLVWQELVTSTAEVFLLWSVSGWRPRMRFSFPHLKQVLGFSIQVFSAQLGTFVQRRSDALLIGLFFGPVAVGLYRLADRMVNLVIEIATRPFTVVALPHFSRYQDDPEGLRQGVLRCIKSTTLVTLPMMALISGMAGLICLTLGSKWFEAAPVIRVLCFVGACRTVTLFAGPLLQASGRPSYFAWMTWSLAGANVIGYITVGMLLRNASDGMQTMGMACARAGVFCLLYAPVNISMIMLAGRLKFSEILIAGCRGLLGATASFLVAFVSTNLLEGSALPPVVRLLGVGILSVSVGVTLTLRLDPELRQSLLEQLGRFRSRRPAKVEPQAQPIPVEDDDQATPALSGTQA